MRPSPDVSELFCTSLGQGIPMLVMHGGPGLDHTYLRPGLDPLADAVELIYYDQRGNGRSASPSDWQEVSHATWADEADTLRARFGHERVLLFGHSYGAFIAMEYALRHPDHLAGLVLCSAAPALDYPEVIAANAQACGTPEQAETALAGFSAPAPDDAAIEALFLRILPLYFHRFTRDHAERFCDTVYRADAFNHAFFRCLPTMNIIDRLKEITIPVLLLAGRTDWITPPTQGVERLRAALPDSELRIFDESGHFPFLEQPWEFRDAVRGWISRRFSGQPVLQGA